MRISLFIRPIHRLLILVAASALVLAACNSDATPTSIWPASGKQPIFPYTVYGDVLSVTVEKIDVKDRFYFRDLKGDTYVINPATPGNRLAAAFTHIRNHGATQVLLDISPEVINLRDKEDREYLALNPYAEVTTKLAPNVPANEPVLEVIWGPYDMPKDHGIIAWTFYELPQKVVPARLRWNQVDVIFVPFLPTT